MSFTARRKTRHRAAKRRKKTATTSPEGTRKHPVPGPKRIVLARGLPPRPKGYLTHQKGDKLIAVKMERRGGKKGRKVCR